MALCQCVSQKKLCVRSLDYIVGASPPVKICVSVHWVTLWVRPPPLCEYMCVRLLGYIVGVSPPRVCPFIGRQSSMDPCMLPTPLCGIFKSVSFSRSHQLIH